MGRTEENLHRKLQSLIDGIENREFEKALCSFAARQLDELANLRTILEKIGPITAAKMLGQLEFSPLLEQLRSKCETRNVSKAISGIGEKTENSILSEIDEFTRAASTRSVELGNDESITGVVDIDKDPAERSLTRSTSDNALLNDSSIREVASGLSPTDFGDASDEVRKEIVLTAFDRLAKGEQGRTKGGKQYVVLASLEFEVIGRRPQPDDDWKKKCLRPFKELTSALFNQPPAVIGEEICVRKS